MRCLAESIEFKHHDTMHIAKDPELVKPWVFDMAKRGYVKYLIEILMRVSDEKFLTECLVAETFVTEDEAKTSGDADLAKAIFEVARNLFSVELSHMRYQSCRPPMNFVFADPCGSSCSV